MKDKSQHKLQRFNDALKLFVKGSDDVFSVDSRALVEVKWKQIYDRLY